MIRDSCFFFFALDVPELLSVDCVGHRNLKLQHKKWNDCRPITIDETIIEGFADAH